MVSCLRGCGGGGGRGTGLSFVLSGALETQGEDLDTTFCLLVYCNLYRTLVQLREGGRAPPPAPQGTTPPDQKFSAGRRSAGNGTPGQTSPERKRSPDARKKNGYEDRDEDGRRGRYLVHHPKIETHQIHAKRHRPPTSSHLFSPPLPPLSACFPPAAPAPFRACPLCYFGTSPRSFRFGFGGRRTRYEGVLATVHLVMGVKWDGAAVFRAWVGVGGDGISHRRPDDALCFPLSAEF